jgi:hypothetical protein
MKRQHRTAALIVAAAVLFSQHAAPGQTPTPVRRAIPVEEPPVARALPVETPPPARAPTIMRALPAPVETEPIAPAPPPDRSSAAGPPDESTEPPDQRQLNYAQALFGRKLYDLAVPEYEKFLGLYPDSPDRASALFYWPKRISSAAPCRAHELQSVGFPEATRWAPLLRPRGDRFQ